MKNLNETIGLLFINFGMIYGNMIPFLHLSMNPELTIWQFLVDTGKVIFPSIIIVIIGYIMIYENRNRME